MGWVVAGVQQVDVLHVHHDWMDYAAACAGIAGVIGAIVALVALVIAKQSADDAKVQREEAEAHRALRERRANPEATLEVEKVIRSKSGRSDVLLVLKVMNTGSRVCEHLVANFLLPDSLNWEHTDNAGKPQPQGEIGQMPHPITRQGNAKFWSNRYGRIDAEGRTISTDFFRLLVPAGGQYLLQIALTHEDLAENARRRYWLLVIPASGDKVTVDRIKARSDTDASETNAEAKQAAESAVTTRETD
jgi:hypothetical protein